VLADQPLVKLSAEQQAALDTILNQEESDHILTGKAGAGKSTVVRALQAAAPLHICATTGVAALNVGGCTLDALFCLNRETWKVYNEYRLSENMRRVARRIVIDECSMIGERMSEVVFNAARRYDKQLILVGDFAQAAPVKENFAITSPLFARANLINLRECHRQNGGVYLDALNKVRTGTVDAEVTDVFRSRVAPLPADSDEMTMRVFGTRAKADATNAAKLNAIQGTTIMCTAVYRDLRDPDKIQKYPLTEDTKNAALEKSPMAHGKAFKAGARIMLTVNCYSEDRTVFVNGDLGTIIDIKAYDGSSLKDAKRQLGKALTPAVFVVRLDRTGKEIDIRQTTMPVFDGIGEAKAEIVGFPMALGWAVTAHKCQGLTLPRCLVDLESISYHPVESRHGLAYVALSRVRELGDLYLTGWNPDAIYCAPSMRKFIAA
jgi:ATP-dependent exoDNAse (exonuclease V) alpha subunit